MTRARELGITVGMNEQPTASPWAVAVRIGLIVSAAAAAVAVALTAFGDVSQTAIVIVVIVVGFVASWIHTGRAVEAPPVERVPAADHRASRHVGVR